MTIHRLLQHSAFNQDDIDRMVAAYEHCLETLGLADRSDPVTELIAKQIIEIAQTGERDPLVISEQVAEVLQRPPR
ncbi:MAG TPA: hypothetical protein VN938_10960 [Xanthobacteraceae bacterium]|nr:hypothetical protein [Xanthobacteraceae bacterium]